MTPPRIGCIDIGSNTTRLLVADREGAGLTEVAAVRAFTALGAGRAAGDPLPAERIAAVVLAVGEQLALARELGATAVDVVATAAVRGAPNGPDLVEAVRRVHGVEVRVLLGAEEAAYAFAGATLGLDPADAGPDTVLAVVDVGGGSTELVLGTLATGPTWSVSLPIGSARLPPCLDPPCPDDLAALRAEVAAAFAPVAPPVRPALALAVGGSATSVTRLVGSELSAHSLRVALTVLQSAPAADVASLHLLDERRVALLPAGLVLLEAAVTALGAPLRVAGGGLREGLLLASPFTPR
jgi:exopolyphosphatase/guanosine-5'-triphosphate,3'-diphosphate pyrophosphatase